jgi:hypothetical protein
LPNLEALRFLLRSVIRLALIFVVGLYIIGSIAGGICLGWIAVHPPRRPITLNEQEKAEESSRQQNQNFRIVEMQTPDGIALRAWFITPPRPNGNAVILLHGVSDNRLGMYGYGQWFLRSGYAVLLPDARGHGESEGIASYGVKESDDVHRWVDWIEGAIHPDCIFGLGESMGAAQLLQALPKEPRFCAVVAESPFATFREVAYARFGRPFHTGPWIGKTIFRLTVDIGFLYVRLRYGLNMEDASPADSVATSKIPILLIHGLEDRNIPPFHSEQIRLRNPSDVELWMVPGAAHTGAHQVSPDEFERRLMHFLQLHSS